MPAISILCGLGNPGPDYRNTRHNLGGMVLDLLSDRHGLSWKRSAPLVMEAGWRSSTGRIVLLKPLTFMNLSGEALASVPGIDPVVLLVIFDDISLPLGRLRIREKGGSGGHKGLESVVDHLGTGTFARLRLGIGSPPEGVDWADFVLSPFPDRERALADEMVGRAADALELIVASGLGEAMQVYNRRDSL